MTPDATMSISKPQAIQIQNDNPKSKESTSLSDVFSNGARESLDLAITKSEHHPSKGTTRRTPKSTSKSNSIQKRPASRSTYTTTTAARRPVNLNGVGNAGLGAVSEHGEYRFRRHRSWTPVTSPSSSPSTTAASLEQPKSNGNDVAESTTNINTSTSPENALSTTATAAVVSSTVSSISRRRASTTTTHRRARSSRIEGEHSHRHAKAGERERGRSTRNSNSSSSNNKGTYHHHHSKQQPQSLSQPHPGKDPPINRPLSVERSKEIDGSPSHDQEHNQQQQLKCLSPKSTSFKRRLSRSAERRRSSRRSSGGDGRRPPAPSSTTNGNDNGTAAPSTPDGRRGSSSRYSSRERSRPKRHESSPATASLRRMKKGSLRNKMEDGVPGSGKDKMTSSASSPSNGVEASQPSTGETPQKSPNSTSEKEIDMDFPTIPKLKEQNEFNKNKHDVDNQEKDYETLLQMTQEEHDADNPEKYPTRRPCDQTYYDSTIVVGRKPRSLNEDDGDTNQQQQQQQEEDNVFDTTFLTARGTSLFHPPDEETTKLTQSSDESIPFNLISPMDGGGRPSKPRSAPSTPSSGKKDAEQSKGLNVGEKTLFDLPFASLEQDMNDDIIDNAAAEHDVTGQSKDEEIAHMFDKSIVFPLNSPMLKEKELSHKPDMSTNTLTAQSEHRARPVEKDKLSKMATNLNTTSHGKKKRLGNLLGKFKTFNKLDDGESVFSVDVQDSQSTLKDKPKVRPVSLVKTLNTKKVSSTLDKSSHSGVLSFSMDLAVSSSTPKYDESSPSAAPIPRPGLFSKAPSIRQLGAAIGAKQFQSFDDSGMLSFALDSESSPTKQNMQLKEVDQGCTPENDIFGEDTFGARFVAGSNTVEQGKEETGLGTWTEEGIVENNANYEETTTASERLDTLFTHSTVHKTTTEHSQFGGLGKLDTLLSQTTHNKSSTLPDPSVCQSLENKSQEDHVNTLEGLLEGKPNGDKISDLAEPSVCEVGADTGDKGFRLEDLLSKATPLKKVGLALEAVAESFEDLANRGEGHGGMGTNDESQSLSASSLPGDLDVPTKCTRRRSRSHSDDSLMVTNFKRDLSDDVSVFDQSIMTAEEQHQFLQLNLPGMDGYKSSSPLAVVEHTFPKGEE